MAGITFSKEVVQSMINTFGKEQAIEEMTNACRVWLIELVNEIAEDDEPIEITNIFKSGDL